MDILVTTPKTEIANAAKEAKYVKDNGGGYYYRVFNKLPKVEAGDKVFYTENGYITGFAEVLATNKDKGKFNCEVTDKAYIGDFVVMDASTWKWIKPIPYKGFQGFRYVKNLEYEIIGDWLDPKPE